MSIFSRSYLESVELSRRLWDEAVEERRSTRVSASIASAARVLGRLIARQIRSEAL